MDRKTEYLKRQRDDAGEFALNAIKELRSSLGAQEDAIREALAGNPVRSGDMVPNHQRLNEVVTYGAEFRSLWNAVGLLER